MATGEGACLGRTRRGRQGYLECGRRPCPRTRGLHEACGVLCTEHVWGLPASRAPGGPDPHRLGASRQADSEGTQLSHLARSLILGVRQMGHVPCGRGDGCCLRAWPARAGPCSLQTPGACSHLSLRPLNPTLSLFPHLARLLPHARAHATPGLGARCEGSPLRLPQSLS